MSKTSHYNQIIRRAKPPTGSGMTMREDRAALNACLSRHGVNVDKKAAFVRGCEWSQPAQTHVRRSPSV